jgi:hypothetical protein
VSIFDDRDRTPNRNRRAETDASDDLPDRVRGCETRLIVLSGEDGTNGKVGTLRRDVDDERSNRRGWQTWIASIAITALLTGAGALYSAARDDGAEARTIEHMRSQISVLQGQADRSASEIAALQIRLAGLMVMLPEPTPRRRTGDKP